MASDDAHGDTSSINAAKAYCSLRPAHSDPENPERSFDDGNADGDRLLERPERFPALTPSEIRSHFPAISDPEHSHGFAFFENAGGSQAPAEVADAIHRHVCHGFAQLGAGYPQSNRADAVADAAHAVVRNVMGVVPCHRGGKGGDVAIGPSSTQLLANLGRAMEDGKFLTKEDDVVIHRAAHEANVAPWVNLARRVGCRVVWWNDADDQETPETSGADETERSVSRRPKPPGSRRADSFGDILTKNAKLVAVCHVSNLLGGIVDAEAIVRLVREKCPADCQVVLDSVAFAPHRALAVSQWDVDWCAFSPYKTFGPHCGCLYGSEKAFQKLAEFGPNHYFVDPRARAYKFELGGVAHETCAGLLGMGMYIRIASGGVRREETHREIMSYERLRTHVPSREDVLLFFERVRALEAEPQKRLMRLLERLERDGSIRVFGPRTADPEKRVPTVSFVPAGGRPETVPEAVARGCRADAHKIAVRSGSMYAARLCEDLGVDPDRGVVRVSLAHYNTVEEVDRFERAVTSALMRPNEDA
jgi:selenocysteine lyase/cysteine desulfurase